MKFDETFEKLTGHTPFPWQKRLHEEFVNGRIPASCNLPTGLGKTSVVGVWLIALAHSQGKLPRRLVYVVNRRTVVDQTTAEAENLRKNLCKPELAELKERLQALCAASYDVPLAISTLRGQFADNREWSADPARPAVICGTVDMIGSRLLFSGYGIGFKSRPLHAGFLGQDALLVHDEAHLEPAFQKLIEAIQREQEKGERTGELPWPKLRVMALSATARIGEKNGETDKPFELTSDEKSPPEELPYPPTEPIHHVWRRLKAKKQLRLKKAHDDGRIAEEIAERALRLGKDDQGNDTKAAVLIFVRTLDDVKKVCSRLTNKKDGVPEDHIQPLTGTMRGLERDRMADPRRPDASRVFARFLKPPRSDAPEDEQWRTTPMPGTVFLVCTSAGEVGIDISADHMVCDLSTFESMAQRLGRVNRYGNGHARIDVVYPAKLDEKDKLKDAREATLKLLQELDGDASPLNLSRLDRKKRSAAFAPAPTILPATDILFDAWALTSIRQPMPGRPPVGPYLHGIAEWEPPETYVAWREEVGIITGDLLDEYPPEDLLDEYPLKPHELLRDATDRKSTGVFAQLSRMAERVQGTTIWIVDVQGEVKPAALQEVVDGNSRRLYGATVILPPSVGGLTPVGTLDGDARFQEELRYDVSDIALSQAGARIRVWSDDPEYASKTAEMRRVCTIEIDMSEGEEAEPRRWEWYESTPLEGGRTAKKPVTLDTHTEDVENRAQRIVTGLSLLDGIAEAILLAAKLHDHGKERERFQIALGNRCYPDLLLAKSGRKGARLPEPFRHEFASVADAANNGQVRALSPIMQDLVLHLIAAHHGRARPHFDLDEAFDPDAEALAIETPRRFARLQRKYGRWGLAYLESLLRAADWAASAEPSAYADEVEGKP